MGPKFHAVLVIWLPLLCGVAGAQPGPPAAAFPAANPPANPPPSAPSPASSAAPAPQAPVAPAQPAPVTAVAPAAAPAQEAYPGPYAYPPPGYAYGYYYPAPPSPLAPPPLPLLYADDAAVASSPFFDAIVLAADWQHRFSESVNVGAQAGAYFAGRLRLTAKIAFPTESMGDTQADYGSGTKDPSFFYAFSAGVAAVRTATFVLSPGLMFARTDVGDYGSMLGLSLPFDWVTKSGLRLGLEGGLGRAFGGQRTVNCATPGAADCSQQPRYEDRDAGLALWLQFQLGFGFNHPGPLAPTSRPAPAAAAPPMTPPPAQ